MMMVRMSEIEYATEKSDIVDNQNVAEECEIGGMYMCIDGV